MKLDSSIKELVFQAISTLISREIGFSEKFQMVLEINRDILHQTDLEQYEEAVFRIVDGFYNHLLPLVHGSKYLSLALKQLQSEWTTNHSVSEFGGSILAKCTKICRDVHLYQKLKGKSGLEIYSILNNVYIYEIPLSEEMKEEIRVLSLHAP
jgi:hypothetical protein